MAQGYKIDTDEPWTFLDAKLSPVHGRRLTFVLDTGEVVMVNVTMTEYRNPDALKAKVEKEIAATQSVKELFA